MKKGTDILVEKALKVTAQRAAVMEFLHGNTGHPSAEEILAKVRKKFPYISRATVYNTVKALTKAGAIREVMAEQGRARFDPNVSQHHHFKCVKCGKVEDMPYGILTAEQVKGRVSGHRVKGVHVLIEGTCQKCS